MEVVKTTQSMLLHWMDFFCTCFAVAYMDESGVTPAHFAAQSGHLDCLRVSALHVNLDVHVV